MTRDQYEAFIDALLEEKLNSTKVKQQDILMMLAD